MKIDSDKKNELEFTLNDLEVEKSKLITESYFLLPHQIPIFAIPVLLSVLLSRFLANQGYGELPQLLGLFVFTAMSASWFVIFFRLKRTKRNLTEVIKKISDIESEIKKCQ